MLLIVHLLEFHRRNVTDAIEQATVVESIDPFQGSEFDVPDTAPWTATMDDFGPVQSVDRIGQGVVARVVGAADRRLDAACSKPLAVANRQVLHTNEQFQRLLREHGITCSMSRSGNYWANAAMESVFSTLKTERTSRKNYQSPDEARADVFDYIERLYNPKRQHSTLGYLSSIDYEKMAHSG